MIELLRWAASLATIVAAILVAANVSVKLSGMGFIIFSAASILWVIIGVVDDEPALTIQNIALTLINLAGIYRYLIRPAVMGKKPEES